MHRTRGSVRHGTALSAAFMLPALLLAGCTSPADASLVSPASALDTVPIYPGVAVTDDVPYPAGGGGTQLLDICELTDVAASTINNGPRRALLLVHGGSWREGDKASTWWRSTCEWLASEGFVVFNVNYRLAPAAPYPAAIEDVRAAVAWARHPDQVARYGYDPALIGAVGGSAGGNLVSLLGTEGEGNLGTGSRVAAVVELSAPTDLRRSGLDLGTLPAGFDRTQLDYLGCANYSSCATAEAATPQTHVDPSDPPFFIGHSLEEFIPVEHGRSLAASLADAGVPATLVEVPGIAHSIGLLGTSEPTAMREQIVEFLRGAL
ncbi:alpha/beta hydrolase [Salinibacterium sp. SYSU T00001]|uniref:alpha/beta hydrolase n=1 Tax=Homoserinimonas sedimenticola TaxID=2986805 RepID=UPI002236AD4B|nr:alpha/beta hydrolase [Salinibacterium sedimenticola]MCW4385474.1 alpha/beta hydrolase [Salinibacterium sedimenticola]